MALKRFTDWGILPKLATLVIIAILPIAMMLLFYFLGKVEDKLYSEKQVATRHVVETAYSILEIKYKKFINGELTEEQAREEAKNGIKNLRYEGDNYFWINDMVLPYPRMVMHSTAPQLDGKVLNDPKYNCAMGKNQNLFQAMVEVCRKDGDGYVDYLWPKPGQGDKLFQKISYVKEFKAWGWVIGSGIYVDDVEEEVWAFTWNILISLLLAILIAAGAAFYIVKVIQTPIKKLDEASQELAAGNLDTEVDIDSQDEIGRLGEVFNEMIENIRNSMEEIKQKQAEAEEAKHLAEEAKIAIEEQQQYLEKSVENMLGAMEKFAVGDLTARLNVDSDDAIGRLFAGFNQAVENISESIAVLNEMANNVATTSTEISSNAEEMAAGSHEQAAQANEVAGAVEEVAVTIQENTSNANSADEAATHAGESAREGGQVIAETIDGMNKIAEVVLQSVDIVQKLGKSSDQIGEIVQVINDIADQTNLLALNAAIEAARAGEHGRGFAVVADEVRQLAEKTSKATNEIASMINQIQSETEDAVQAIQAGTKEVESGKVLAAKAGNALDEIISGTGNVAEIIRRVAIASDEQTKAISEISRNIEGISTVSEQAASGVNQISEATESLNQLTIQLQELINKFKV